MIDNKTIEQLDNSAVKMTVTVSANGAQEAYDKLLAEYGKQAKIPGFRKGKVPRNVLVRKFDDEIKYQAATDIIDSAMKEILEEIEENPISQPVLEDLPSIDLGQPYIFTVTYDVFPEIKLGEYKGITIEEPRVKILKNHENDELEAVRNQNAVVVDKEDGLVSLDAVVTMDYVVLDDNEVAIEETRRQGYVFTVGETEHPYQIEDEIDGMKVGEEKIIEKTYGDDAKPSLENRGVKLRVSITAVKKRLLPDLDDELAQDISEDLPNLGALRKKIKNDLKERADNQIKTMKLNQLTETILENTEVAVPSSMVNTDLENTWKNYVKESGVSENVFIQSLKDHGRSKADILSTWREDATKSIKTQLIYGKIIEAEKIEITDEEIAEELEKRAETFNIPSEELEKIFGGPQFQQYLKNELTQKKLFDFLLESASVKKGEKIDYTELMGA